MLLRVDERTKNAERVVGSRLTEFGLDERGLQDISPFQVRSATVQHRRHGGVNGRGKGGVKGFSRRRRCEHSEHP